MNERLKKLARQAGFDIEDEGNEIWFDEGWYTSIVERFAELVRQDEREACAKLCDDWAKFLDDLEKYDAPIADACAKSIRERGEK